LDFAQASRILATRACRAANCSARAISALARSTTGTSICHQHGTSHRVFVTEGARRHDIPRVCSTWIVIIDWADAFQIAQRAERSLVAGALAQTAARISKGLGPLADLVRERQDLVLEWQRLDKRLETALSSAAAQRDDAEERRIQERLDAISRRMDHYRTLHFVTHGALAGELGPMAEAGIVLTPPASASAIDDGFLTASEISELRLDADWVILSACNTAGASRAGAEALPSTRVSPRNFPTSPSSPTPPRCRYAMCRRCSVLERCCCSWCNARARLWFGSSVANA
jgi:hypothetical protein